jgi:hypothetical protein
MTTSGRSQRTSNESKFWGGASPVSPSASQEHDEDKTTSAGSGQPSSGAFAYFDPVSCSWRTCPDSSVPSMSEDLTAAYVAGLLDGEGCIYLAKAKKHFSPRIDVGMTETAADVLFSLEAEFGGHVRQTRPPTEKWARALAWTITGMPAVDCLRRVVPYLKLKGEQARLLIWLWDWLPRRASGSIIWDAEGRAEAEWVRENMTELNRKGPSAQPAGDTWRTSQGSLFEEWATYSGTWPRSGSMLSGVVYRQPPWVRLTSDGGSSLLPVSENHQALYPTPSNMSYGSSGNGTGNNTVSRGRPSLETMARRGWWPTPNASDYKGATTPEAAKDWAKRGTNLSEAAQLATVGRWPTPTARLGEQRGAQAKRYTDPKRSNDLDDAVAASGATGSLNPTWVEWLMGFPLGWTDLEPSETP